LSLSDVSSVLSIAEFGARIISQLRKKKQKSKIKPRKRKQTKEEELINGLLTNPENTIKKIGAEYLVKNRQRLIRKIEKKVLDEL